MSAQPDLSHTRMFERGDRRHQAEYWSATSTRGMMATAHYLATRVGADILAQGGNAFDAAVAAALALGVCEPAASGLGGMAIALAHDAAWNRTFVIEGACRAPQAATPSAVAAADRYRGYQAVAVPTHVAVLQHLLSHYGTMAPAQVLAPAIALAHEGVPLTHLQHRNVQRDLETLRHSTAGEPFLDPQGHPRPPGTIIRLPRLGATLERLSTAGFEDFYHGQIARTIVEDMHAHGGYVGALDLASSRLCLEGPPIVTSFRNEVVISAGPPAGGLALLQMLGVLSAIDASLDLNTPEGVVLLAAIIREVRRDRRRFRLKVDAQGLGQAARLLTPEHAARAAADIRMELGAVDSSEASTGARTRSLDGETSHLSVMDSAGNVVALTQSIERSFGAAVVTPGLGFLYNGYLRAFKVQNPQHPHFLRPGAPARSNAAPTIALRNGRPWAALGSTGSERAVSGIFQTLVRLARQSPFEAVRAPRLHCTPESEVMLEADRFPPESLAALTRHGFRLTPLDAYSFQMGGLQLVTRAGDTLVGIGEPRRDSAASGPDGR